MFNGEILNNFPPFPPLPVSCLLRPELKKLGSQFGKDFFMVHPICLLFKYGKNWQQIQESKWDNMR